MLSGMVLVHAEPTDHRCLFMQSPLITDAYPLHKAVAYYDVQGVKSALAKGANPNQAVQHSSKNTEQYTPMRVAMESIQSCGGGCSWVPATLQDIVAHLLCAGKCC